MVLIIIVLVIVLLIVALNVLGAVYQPSKTPFTVKENVFYGEKGSKEEMLPQQYIDSNGYISSEYIFDDNGEYFRVIFDKKNEYMHIHSLYKGVMNLQYAFEWIKGCDIRCEGESISPEQLFNKTNSSMPILRLSVVIVLDDRSRYACILNLGGYIDTSSQNFWKAATFATSIKKEIDSIN